MKRIVAWIAVVTAAAGACDKPPTVPPELSEPQRPTLDTKHTATLTGAERVALANVLIEIDSAGDSVTLRSDGDAAESAIYLTGVARAPVTSRSSKGHGGAGREFDVTGTGKQWLEGSGGLRTPLWRYQAEAAVIRIESMNDEDAHGRIEGTFYRFDRADPLGRPPTAATFKGSFTARVVH